MSTVWIAAAVIVIIALRRLAPIAGSVFAILVSLAIGVWGYWAYNHGGGVGLVFSNQQLPQSAFYGVVALWSGVEIYGLIRNLRHRPEQPASED